MGNNKTRVYCTIKSWLSTVKLLIHSNYYIAVISVEYYIYIIVILSFLFCLSCCFILSSQQNLMHLIRQFFLLLSLPPSPTSILFSGCLLVCLPLSVLVNTELTNQPSCASCAFTRPQSQMQSQVDDITISVYLEPSPHLSLSLTPLTSLAHFFLHFFAAVGQVNFISPTHRQEQQQQQQQRQERLN